MIENQIYGVMEWWRIGVEGWKEKRNHNNPHNLRLKKSTVCWVMECRSVDRIVGRKKIIQTFPKFRTLEKFIKNFKNGS